MKDRIQLSVEGFPVEIYSGKSKDYISLTDIARYKNSSEPKDVIKNWMRNRNTIEFLGLWEKINNKDFKGVEFDPFRQQAGLNSFVLSPQKWIRKMNAIGIVNKSGRHGGGTFAHKDIAFEFASWISPEFKLYLITEFQRYKEKENLDPKYSWNISRILSKVNYKIHTDAIKQSLIPNILSKGLVNKVYADEADILNLALFGQTAKDWRKRNSSKKGNIRDYATIEQLVVLSNLESINAELIRSGEIQQERLIKLNQVAIYQMKSLLGLNAMKKLV